MNGSVCVYRGFPFESSVPAQKGKAEKKRSGVSVACVIAKVAKVEISIVCPAQHLFYQSPDALLRLYINFSSALLLFTYRARAFIMFNEYPVYYSLVQPTEKEREGGGTGRDKG